MITSNPMKLLLLSVLVFNLQLISGQSKSVDSIIDWNANYKLSWADFTGKPNDDILGDALTSYKIEVIPSNVQVDENEYILNYEKLNAKAEFYKNYSWHIESGRDLLKHEQLHFDIAELFARKIRKEFKNLKNRKERKFSNYLECYKLWWKVCREYQAKYDEETRNGREKEINKEWEIKIKNELKLLSAYSN